MKTETRYMIEFGKSLQNQWYYTEKEKALADFDRMQRKIMAELYEVREVKVDGRTVDRVDIKLEQIR